MVVGLSDMSNCRDTVLVSRRACWFLDQVLPRTRGPIKYCVPVTKRPRGIATFQEPTGTREADGDQTISARWVLPQQVHSAYSWLLLAVSWHADLQLLAVSIRLSQAVQLSHSSLVDTAPIFAASLARAAANDREKRMARERQGRSQEIRELQRHSAYLLSSAIGFWIGLPRTSRVNHEAGDRSNVPSASRDMSASPGMTDLNVVFTAIIFFRAHPRS